MQVYIEPIGRLINEFSKLPGVGKKSAQRYAYKIIGMSDSEAQEFAAAILNVKKKVKYCKICGNFTENEVCDVCKERDKRTICVVKEPKDVIALEKLHEYKGVYHVLHGVISPMEGVGPDDIRIRELWRASPKAAWKRSSSPPIPTWRETPPRCIWQGSSSPWGSKLPA